MDRRTRFPFQFVVDNRQITTEKAIRSLDPRESVDLVVDVHVDGCVSLLSAFLPLPNTESIDIKCSGVVSSKNMLLEIGDLLHRNLRPHHRVSFTAIGSVAAETLLIIVKRLDGSEIADTLRLFVFSGREGLMRDTEDISAAQFIESLRQLRTLRSIVVNTDGLLASSEIKHLLNAFAYLESCEICCSFHDPSGNIGVPQSFVGLCEINEAGFLHLAFGRPGLVKYERRAPSNAMIARANG